MNRRRWRRAPASLMTLGVLALGAILILPGCLVISGQTDTQLNTVGTVQIGTTLCSTDNLAGTPPPAASPVCTLTSNSGFNASGASQIMLAYRIPQAAGAPTTFNSVDGTVTMNQNASYAAELQRLFPAPANQRWVGYLSQAAVTLVSTASQSFSFQTEFTLNRGADGSPFVGPFSYRTVSGARLIDNTTTPPTSLTRPVVCGATTADITSDLVVSGGTVTTICFDSPNPATSTIPLNIDQPTRDLGVLGGGAVVGSPGALVPVPFSLKYAGTQTTGANFNLTATSTIPGATVQPTIGSIIPNTDTTTPVFVNVIVPSNPTAGAYTVTLTAALSNGQSRSNTMGITIPVKVTFSLPVTSATIARTKGIKIVVTAKTRGKATFKAIQGGKTRATKVVTLKTGKNTIVLRSAKFKAGKYKVTVTGVGLTLTKNGKLR